MTKRIDDVRRAAEKDLANIKQTLQFAQNKVRDYRKLISKSCLDQGFSILDLQDRDLQHDFDHSLTMMLHEMYDLMRF